jgi:hypothetical protein
MKGASNNLDGELKKLNIGRTPGTTFVDNYYSHFGCEYSLSSDLMDQNIVNVMLNPPSSLDDGDKHIYPTPWYTGATNETDNLGLAWSPLVSSMCRTLAPYYEQDWTTGKYALKDTTLSHIPNAFVNTFRQLDLITLLKNGMATDMSNGINLDEQGLVPLQAVLADSSVENNSAYWHTGFTKNPNDVTLEFTYQFLNPGDGDQLGLWIDDELRFIITGSLAGTNSFTSDIDISDLSAGDHILSVALHSYGDVGCSVNVMDFTMISVPEPSTLALLTIATFVGLAGFIFRRKVA